MMSVYLKVGRGLYYTTNHWISLEMVRKYRIMKQVLTH